MHDLQRSRGKVGHNSAFIISFQYHLYLRVPNLLIKGCFYFFYYYKIILIYLTKVTIKDFKDNYRKLALTIDNVAFS